MNEVTRILRKIEQGQPEAAEQLLPLVYAELRELAAVRMADERSGHTLVPTALVHEAYVRLVQPEEIQVWNGRGHFFAAAAEAMRRILIEHARRRNTEKRGGGAARVDVEANDILAPSDSDELLALDAALTRLEQHDSGGQFDVAVP